MSVKIEIDRSAVGARIKAASGVMLAKLSEKILADCNEYCREDQGTLRQSSYTASEPEKGRLVWNTPYARKVYYTGTPSPEPNRKASLMWCDKARDEHGAEWQKAAQKLFSEEMK